MTVTIAIAGKGGTGKTTIAGLLIKLLKEEGRGPILAIDADPASNLNTVLGLPLERTVGDIREDTSDKARAGKLEAGIAKQDLLDYEINSSIVESDGVDLLAMGRPEGPGCYCAANNMLRTIVDRISASYDIVVIDNEAGLEHLSRRTTRDVDVLLVVSDPVGPRPDDRGPHRRPDRRAQDPGRRPLPDHQPRLRPDHARARADRARARPEPAGHVPGRRDHRPARRRRQTGGRGARRQRGVRGSPVVARPDPPSDAKGDPQC